MTQRHAPQTALPLNPDTRILHRHAHQTIRTLRAVAHAVQFLHAGNWIRHTILALLVCFIHSRILYALRPDGNHVATLLVEIVMFIATLHYLRFLRRARNEHLPQESLTPGAEHAAPLSAPADTHKAA